MTCSSGHFLQLATESGNDPLALAALLDRPATEPVRPGRTRGESRIRHWSWSAIATSSARPTGWSTPSPPGSAVVLPGVDHFQTPKAFPFIDAVLEFLDAVPS